MTELFANDCDNIPYHTLPYHVAAASTTQQQSVPQTTTQATIGLAANTTTGTGKHKGTTATSNVGDGQASSNNGIPVAMTVAIIAISSLFVAAVVLSVRAQRNSKVRSSIPQPAPTSSRAHY